MDANLSEIKRKTTQKNKVLLYPKESYIIQGACYSIYKAFRNTQKESVYLRALERELILKDLNVHREKQFPVFHMGIKVGTYTPDLIVEESIIIELKAKPFLHSDDIKQFWYYLKNTTFRLGYLINFGEKDGVKFIRRIYDKARKNAKPKA